jgi:hypothetical protein
MKTKTAAIDKKPTRKQRPKTTLVGVRFSGAHLAELDTLADLDGVKRSAQIQRAVGEYLERRRK